YSITVIQCISETFEQYNAHSARPHRSLRVFIKDAGMAVRGGNTSLLMPITSAMRYLNGNSTGQRHITLVIEQALYPQVDRNQRGRAGRSNADARPLEVELIGSAGSQVVF